MSVERLIVVEHLNGPIITTGSFVLSGSVIILGRSCPRDVTAAGASELEDGAAERD